MAYVLQKGVYEIWFRTRCLWDMF